MRLCIYHLTTLTMPDLDFCALMFQTGARNSSMRWDFKCASQVLLARPELASATGLFDSLAPMHRAAANGHPQVRCGACHD